jgi:hypothetical protein
VVGFEHLFGQAAADVGFCLVVAVDHLDRAAADFVAGVLQADLEAVLQFAAEGAFGAGEGGDEADLDRLLGVGEAQPENVAKVALSSSVLSMIVPPVLVALLPPYGGWLNG